MPDFGSQAPRAALRVAGNGYQVVPAAAAGIDLTPGNSWANSGYVQVTAGIADAIYILGARWNTTTGIEQFELDIATGAAASEVPIITIPSAQIGNATITGFGDERPAYFPYPVAVAAGVRISIRGRRESTALLVVDFKLIYCRQIDLVAL